MTREETKTLLPIITAFAEGKTIEVMNTSGHWDEINIPNFDVDPKKYRIKPDSKFRSFENAEEFLDVMKQHIPCGWVRLKKHKKGWSEYCNIISFTDSDITIQTGQGSVMVGYPLAFETLVFSDNKPFGVYKKSDV